MQIRLQMCPIRLVRDRWIFLLSRLFQERGTRSRSRNEWFRTTAHCCHLGCWSNVSSTIQRTGRMSGQMDANGSHLAEASPWTLFTSSLAQGLNIHPHCWSNCARLFIKPDLQTIGEADSNRSQEAAFKFCINRQAGRRCSGVESPILTPFLDMLCSHRLPSAHLVSPISWSIWSHLTSRVVPNPRDLRRTKTKGRR